MLRTLKRHITFYTFFVLTTAFAFAPAMATETGYDLKKIKEAGVLRHLGVPYANFIAGDGTGLDIELMKLFADSIGVRYEYVPTSWKTVISDLIGYRYSVESNTVTLGDAVEVKGDVIANGLTILGWRKDLIDFSAPTFPTQVWLITDDQSELRPVVPTQSLDSDIQAVKGLIGGKSVLGVPGTCLDHTLYNLSAENAENLEFNGSLNDLAPAVIQGAADTALLDVPDSLVALNKWPGQIKILGPISARQEMGVGFRKDSPELQKAFAAFYEQIRADGTYNNLVRRYYPDVFAYYPDFFTIN